MTDDEAMALNVYEEAGGEITEGRAAIARITLNRMRRRFFSDGTVLGTVFAKDQFSWAWFGFEVVHTGVGVHDLAHREYVRLAHNLTEALALATDLQDMAPPHALAECASVAAQVAAGTFNGPLYDRLTDDAVNYCNPRILTKLPAWAIPSALVCSIGHHDFYRAGGKPAPLVA